MATLHTYTFIGAKIAAMKEEVHALAEVEAVRTDEYVVASIPNDTYLTDLSSFMENRGMGHVGAGNLIPDEAALPITRQAKAAKLTADASAVTPSAWTDVLSTTITTAASGRLKIEASCNAGVLIGGAMRVLIDGGAYSNVVLATSTYPLLSGNAPGQGMTYEDPAADTYTVKVQVQAAALGSVTPRAGSTLFVTEYALPS